jgi:hypothetical protein
MERQSTNTTKRSSNSTTGDRFIKPLRTVGNLFKTRRILWEDPDPDEMSIDNAYKTRWIWYHTILGLELLMVNILLVAILIVLAVKL